MGFPDGSDGKESTCNARDPGLIPGLGRSPGEGNVNPLLSSSLENSMDRGSLAGYSPWGCKDLDTTERLTHRGSNVLCARKKRSDCYYLKVLSEIRECCALQ